MKGLAILGTLRFVKETEGKQVIPELVAELSPAMQAIYEHPILPGNWYPYEAYSGLLAAVTRRLGGGQGEFPSALGRFAAQLDTGSVFRIISVILSPRRALQGAGMLWSRYSDTGRFVMSRIENEKGDGHIEEFPEISPEHEQLLTGWIAGIGLAAGAREATVELVASVHAGSPVTAFRMSWVNR